jgi:hypothetical protein
MFLLLASPNEFTGAPVEACCLCYDSCLQGFHAEQITTDCNSGIAFTSVSASYCFWIRSQIYRCLTAVLK